MSKYKTIRLPKLLACEVSTCHISRHDNDTLETVAKVQDGKRPFAVHTYDYGFYIPILSPDSVQVLLGGMKRFSLSQECQNLVKLASEQGFRLLAIDRDGPEVDGLPTFDW